MKKIVFSFVLVAIFTTSSFGQLTKIGGGLFYDHKYYFNDEVFDDHKLGNPAIFVTGIYEINLPFHLAPRISFFMPNITKFEDIDFSDKTIISGYSLDIDGHYVFNSLDRFELYGLTGLNILYVRRKQVYESTGFPSEVFKDSQNAFGFNLGLGSYMKVKEQFDLYFEVKAIIASQIQFVATAGILLNVDWLKKNEEAAF